MHGELMDANTRPDDDHAFLMHALTETITKPKGPTLMTPSIRAKPLPDPDRVKAAIELAEGTFWGAIAAAFPEVTTGDISPDGKFRRDAGNERDVANWLSDNWPMVELHVGMRVYFPRGTDSHHTALTIEADEVGTVVEIDGGPLPQVKVKLDQHHAGAEEWGNCYVWTDDEVREELLTDILPLETYTWVFTVEAPSEVAPSELIERLTDEPGVHVLSSSHPEDH